MVVDVRIDLDERSPPDTVQGFQFFQNLNGPEGVRPVEDRSFGYIASRDRQQGHLALQHRGSSYRLAFLLKEDPRSLPAVA